MEPHHDQEPDTAPLTAESLLTQAERATGLADWGDAAFRDGLERLLASIHDSANLSSQGRKAVSLRFQITLQNRLKLIDDRKRIPAIAQQQIRRPIIVLGLPRSGSSNLLDLLSQDPANRAPRTWEMMMPSPPPQPASADSDPRIGQVQQALDAQHFSDPDLQSAHPFGARQPEECGFILEMSFLSGNFPAFFHCPAYTDWYLNRADYSVAYRFHRQFLQHLQSGFAGERWALKSPEHSYHPFELAAEYPDAIFVQTHRDPMRVLPSITSLVSALRRLFSDRVDPLEIARWKVELNRIGLERTWQLRQRPQIRDQFYDIQFQDLIERPMETVGRFYAHFDLPLSHEAREAMQRYVDGQAKARHGHGRHVYSAAGFGFDRDEIEAVFGEYMRRHAVPREAVHS